MGFGRIGKWVKQAVNATIGGQTENIVEDAVKAATIGGVGVEGEGAKKEFNKMNESGLGGISGFIQRETYTDFGARDMQDRADRNALTEAQIQAKEVERQAKAAEEARIFAEFTANETNKAIKAEEDRKRTLFGGEIEQQLREKKALLGEAKNPEEIARREFLRRRLLGI